MQVLFQGYIALRQEKNIILMLNVVEKIAFFICQKSFFSAKIDFRYGKILAASKNFGTIGICREFLGFPLY